MATETPLVEYYAKRASEYESIYFKPERQANLQELKKLLTAGFLGERVLEVACGTGYWTEVISHTAGSILALDINKEVLDIARSKYYSCSSVLFEMADVYELSRFGNEYTGGLSVFWWSHIPRSRLNSFLAGFNRKMKLGAKVCFIDNRYVEGSSTPIFRTDEFGDTFQNRTLQDGSNHEVLKNFPSKEELIDAVSSYGREIRVTELDYFWILEYRVG